MVRLGILNPAQYASRGSGLLSVVRQNRLSYSLLRTNVPASAAEVERFEFVTRHLRLNGGVYRTTRAKRFEDLDQFVQAILEQHLKLDQALRAEDWAASACNTSVEWFEVLSKGFPKISLVASDLHLYLVQIDSPGHGSFIVEQSGDPLQYIKAPFVIPLDHDESGLLPVNRLVQAQARKRFEQLRAQGLLDPDVLGTEQPEWSRGSVTFRRIPMVHPSAVALSQSDGRFQVRQHSVFERSPQQAQIIRAMNIFNKVYFSTERLQQGLRSVWESLEDGGIWIVGRTHDGPQSANVVSGPAHDASVLRKTPTGFEPLASYGNGSEIQALILAFKG